MSEGKLKTAIIGLNENGRLMLEATGRIDCLQIHAVADKDTNLAERIAGENQCAFYDDYRQLIIEMDSRLGADSRCLLVAEDMHCCDEYLWMGMKKKFHVLKMSPAARDFEEAVKFVRLSEDEDIKFAIANPGRFAGSFQDLRKFIQEGGIEQTFLMTAFCNVGEHPYLKWQTDPKLAGGGVLLHNCYKIIDQMIWNFDMPQHVYSLNTNQAKDKQQRLYLTEDTTVLTMKFSDTFIGNLIASRREGTGPREEFLRLYGKDKIITISDMQLTVSNGIGEISQQLQYEDDRIDCMTALLTNFAHSILQPEKNKLCSSARENLKNMAAIESAYLSARTGFPEEPEKILQMAAGVTSKARND